MNFDLTEDQKMLVDTAASFAKKSSPVDRFRQLRFGELAYDKKVWKQMGELGWLGVIFPEEVGGFGGSKGGARRSPVLNMSHPGAFLHSVKKTSGYAF